ncbi:MAG: hypothetical protein HY231_13145 [Acidobacteria bacterium]|nr:hypothetical protein [Acidobacteriota bacterium]
MNIEAALRTVPFQSVSLGYVTVHIYSPEQLDEAQLGYAIHPDCTPLTGNKNGDWRTSWIVIAYEDGSGDPIFIDVSTNELSVYTAMNGQASWNAQLIADSLQGFGKALESIFMIAKGRENPAALETHPITENERLKTLEEIRRYNPKANLEFWEIWLTQE